MVVSGQQPSQMITEETKLDQHNYRLSKQGQLRQQRTSEKHLAAGCMRCSPSTWRTTSGSAYPCLNNKVQSMNSSLGESQPGDADVENGSKVVEANTYMYVMYDSIEIESMFYQSVKRKDCLSSCRLPTLFVGRIHRLWHSPDMFAIAWRYCSRLSIRALHIAVKLTPMPMSSKKVASMTEFLACNGGVGEPQPVSARLWGHGRAVSGRKALKLGREPRPKTNQI